MQWICPTAFEAMTPERRRTFQGGFDLSPDYRITKVHSAPETWKLAVTSESREGCVAGVTAATEEVMRLGGLALFNPPSQLMSGLWITDGTAVIFGAADTVFREQRVPVHG